MHFEFVNEAFEAIKLIDFVLQNNEGISFFGVDKSW